MKASTTSTIIFLVCILISKISSAQINDCGNNAGFETGTTAGWVCKSGYYGLGPCPTPLDSCPKFNVMDSIVGVINRDGINAPSDTFNRHTIMTGAGIDPNSVSPFLIPVVAPNGGTYSFRLGNEVPGGISINGKSYAQSEAIQLTFNVDPQKPIFTYRYAAFLVNPGHSAEEQPRFEILIYDSTGNIIPSGYKVVAGAGVPNCWTGTNTFHQGLGAWYYSDWTDVSIDLSAYIGKSITAEFRTSDCFPCAGTNCARVTDTNGVCITNCYNGVCCTSSNCGGGCSGLSSCGNAAGAHSAYAYIDAYCSGFTGVNDFSGNAALKITPNPMNSFTLIEITGGQEGEVIIYTVLGKEVLRRKIRKGSLLLPKEDLVMGIYLVKALIGEKQFIQKLIVQE